MTTAFGLRPVKNRHGAPYTGGNIVRCYVPSSDSNAIYIGDAVELVAMSGASASGANPEGRPTIKRYVNGDSVCDGVVMSVEPVLGIVPGTENLTRLHRPASTAAFINVLMDPSVVFDVAVDSSGFSATTGLIGANVDLTMTAGSTVTGLSAAVVAHTSAATTATLPFKIVDLGQDIVGNTLPTTGGSIIRVIMNTGIDNSQTGSTSF